MNKPENPPTFPSLRDYFAAKAATAEIESWVKEGMRPDYKEVAASCYEFADAMLSERQKPRVEGV